MDRINRIAVRLVSQLEDLYVHKENPYDQDTHLKGEWDRHQKVAKLQKTKKKLEAWFASRKIPIRIVYADSEQISVIPKPGVITFKYEPLLDQEPPTAWMIIHNLAHGIFDYVRSENPHDLRQRVGPSYAEWAQKTIGDMSLGHGRFRDTEGHEENPDAIYPTTRSSLTGAITNDIEAFYEVFSQWVSTGYVRLQSENKWKSREWEQRLEQYFRELVDEVARMGVVIHNI